MLSVRSFSILCLVTACVVAATVVVSEGSGAIPGSGKPLFSDLMSSLNEISRIRVESAEERFVLEHAESGWMVPGKFGYAADGDKVHQLLVGAAGLSRVEPKTSNPDLYSRLDLESPDAEGSGAVAYRFESAGDGTVASLVVGKRGPAKGDPEQSAFYVRLPDDPQAWLVEGKLPSGSKLIDWVEREIAAVDRARVRETTVRHASGDTVKVSRSSLAEDQFRLADAPPSKTVDGQWKINDIGRLFSSLELEDVLPRNQAPLDPDPDYVVTMRTFDGLEIGMRVFKDEKRGLAELTAQFKPRAQTGEDGAEENKTLRSADDVRAEAEALNARWENWVYVLPGYKVDAMARTQSELLKDPAQSDKADQG